LIQGQQTNRHSGQNPKPLFETFVLICRPETPLSLYKQAVRLLRQQQCGDVTADELVKQTLQKALQLLQETSEAQQADQTGAWLPSVWPGTESQLVCLPAAAVQTSNHHHDLNTATSIRMLTTHQLSLYTWKLDAGHTTQQQLLILSQDVRPTLGVVLHVTLCCASHCAVLQ
jgi:hypothetical protein